jgi:2-amino-4-hydroxy-6-hydroxymethyldihydropteridine diphosphokinase
MPAPRLVPAYVALGSNLDDPRAQVGRAFDALAALPETRLVLRSSLYSSRPVGPVEQPDFVNAVAGLLTALEPTATS